MTSSQIPLPALSAAEWKTVAIALRDAQSCGCGDSGAPSRLKRAIRALTGFEFQRPLADPHLETLRRFVCTVRRTRRRDDRMTPALIEQGFNQAQVDALTLLSA